jgi:hypothetical protein
MAALMQTSIPRQVQEAADEAERLEATLQMPPEASGEPPQEPAAPAPQATLTPPAQAPRASDEATWQQRYQTLQGMYNAEVPRMATQIRELVAQLADVSARLAAPKAEPLAPVPKVPAKQASEKDVEVFGSDLIDLIRRQSADLVEAQREQVEAGLKKLAAENAELKAQLGTVVTAQGEGNRQQYFVALERLVPNYQTLNVDPGFLAWLAEIDPLSGVARQAYLANAWGSFDATRTAKLFLAYEQLAGSGTTETPKPTPQQELARQAQPGTSKGMGQVPDEPNARIWQRAQIERFYTDVTKGQYSAKEAQRIEAEIDAAVASGRVR